MSFENSEKKPFSVAPLGGPGGFRWDDGVFTTVRQLVIAHSTGIDSLQIEYDKNGTSVWAEKRGGKGGNSTERVKLAYPDEFLTSVHGYHGSLTERGSVFVRSLTFETNKKTYGPFGVEQGTRFSFPKTGGKIVGFHGRSSVYLNALGIHQIPEEQLKRAPVLANRFISTGTNNVGSTVIQASGGNSNGTVVGPAKQKTDHVDASQPKLSRPEEQLKIPSIAPVSANSSISTETINISSLAIQGNNNEIVGSVKQKNDHIATPQPKLYQLSPLDSSSPGIYDKVVSFQKVPQNSERLSTYGPWGGDGGSPFDDGMHTGIRLIKLSWVSAGIVYLRAEYDDSGASVWGNKHGGTGGYRRDKVAFDYPEEILTRITGSYSPLMQKGRSIIKTLTFYTNKRKYGPFGEEQGPSFSFKMDEGHIVGFHGREGLLLDAIGVHVLAAGGMKPPAKDTDSVAIVKAGAGHAGTGNFPLHNKIVLAKTERAEEAIYGVMKQPALSGPGPWGGDGGRPWDDGVFSGIKQIYITRTPDAICSVQIEYDQNGQSIWSVKHGGSTGTAIHRVKLDYPNEVLVSISGYHGPMRGNEGQRVVKSLTFQTSREKYGPFGEETGSFFSSSAAEGKVVGFHGRSGAYLDAIGVLMQYWLGSKKPSTPSSLFRRFY